MGFSQLGCLLWICTIPISLSLPLPLPLPRCGRAHLNRIRRAQATGSLNHRPGGHRVSSTPVQRRQPPPLHWLGFGCGVGWNRMVLSGACSALGGLVG
uniref:Secreted protein n=1 Tax=Triticum urartu TaxID=4572 RepID=A0A8R7PKA6_TRIUA